MNILVVCQYYHPEQFLVTEVCEQLVREGHGVTVLTGLPNYPSGVVPEEYRHGRRREEWLHGVHVLRCFEIGRKRGALGLALNYFSFMLSAAWRARRLRADADLIFCYQLSPAFMAYPAAVLKKRLKKPLLLYCLDLWPESVRILLRSGDSLLYRLIGRFCTRLYRACDHIAVQSQAFLPYFERVHGIGPERLSVLPQFAPEPCLSETPAEENGLTDFVFLGNVGVAQDMPCLLRAAREIYDLPDWRLHIVGDGSMLDETKRLAASLGLGGRILFHGRRPVEEMPAFYRLADACLLTLSGDSLVGLTVPSKLQGYMAAGKPVLAATDGPAADLIRQARCGACAASGDSAGLAEIMREFITQPQRYAGCGENGRAYFRAHFTKGRHMEALLEQMAALAQRPAGGAPEGEGER